jgi:hypothetical protein
LNCPYCSTSNLDTASICANCGRPLAAGAAPPPPSQSYTPPPPPSASYTPPVPPRPPVSHSAPIGHGGPAAGAQVPNYLVQSILVTLCCCLPFGVVAIIFAAQVNSKLAAGDYAGAVDASQKAKMWSWIAFGLGIVAILISFAFGGAGILQGIRDGMANR